jgi:fermentation-respiration switch protein FrsA (DUF1100 family)
MKNFRFLKNAVRILFAVILLIFGLSLYGLFDVLHPPRRIPPGTTLVEKKVSFQQVNLVTEDGIRLTAWYTPPKPALPNERRDDVSGVEGNGAVILLAHGYGDNRPEWIYALLAKKGYGVLAWDARAHGESDGDISTLGYLEVLDVKAALDFALGQPEVKHIGAWGGSMGGATMIRATAKFPQIEALVVDSSFASLDAEVDFLAPYPLVNPLAKFMLGIGLGVDLDSISPTAAIRNISPRPVYIIHGTEDSVASPDSAEILFHAANEPKFLWVEEGAIHLGIHMKNPPRYERRALRFFDEWLLKISDG